MGRAINYNMTAFCGVVALLHLWCLPVSAETPLHHAELTFADVAPLGPPLFNTRIKNNLDKLERICTSRDGGACYTLGQAMLNHEYAVEASVSRYYKAACDAGHADGGYTSQVNWIHRHQPSTIRSLRGCVKATPVWNIRRTSHWCCRAMAGWIPPIH